MLHFGFELDSLPIIMVRVVLPWGVCQKPGRMDFRALVAALLLIVYTSGSITADLLHHAIHDHRNHELHSPATEADPCHRAIFHNDTEKGCHHKAHLTDVEKCKYSHIVFQAQQLLIREQVAAPTPERAHHFISYYAPLTATSLREPLLRGPPVA